MLTRAQDNITLGGQSAGAIYTHGLLAMNIKPRRAILASGSLYLTAPSDRERCMKIFDWMEKSLRSNRAHNDTRGGRSTDGESTASCLYTAPPEEMTKLVQEAGFYSWWMFDSSLGDWKDDLKVFANVVEAVLLSDCKDEAAPYDSRLRLIPKERQLAAFKSLPRPDYNELAEVYDFEGAQHDDEKWATVVRDFINDARCAVWTQELWHRINAARGTGVTCKAYLCHYDEVNPFGPWPNWSFPVAHHAVDLLAAFGGLDEMVNRATKEAGRLLRGFWINFINGEEPWPSDIIYGFGPDGKNGLICAAEVTDSTNRRGTTPRRRQAHFEVLKNIGIESLTRVWQQLLPTVGVDT